MIDFNRAFVLITYIRSLNSNNFYWKWFKDSEKYIAALCDDDFSELEYQRCWLEYKLVDNVFRQLYGW